jgi:hypothetical protein
MIRDYDALAQAVTAAGFFTNGVEDHGDWHRNNDMGPRLLHRPSHQ